MNPPISPGPQASKAISDVIEYGGKTAVSLTAIYAFVRLIVKPYFSWRKNRQTDGKKREAELIRAVLKEELARLDGVCDREDEIINDQRQMLARQALIFSDVDKLIDIALDNRDRLDEINELLDEIGLASRDRREREYNVEAMLESLNERRKARRRLLEVVEDAHAHKDTDHA